MALALTEANIEALPKVQFGHPDAPEDRILKGREEGGKVVRYANISDAQLFRGKQLLYLFGAVPGRRAFEDI